MYAEASEYDVRGLDSAYLGHHRMMPTEDLGLGQDIKSQIKTGIDPMGRISEETLVQFLPEEQRIFLRTPTQAAKEKLREVGTEMTHQAGLTDMQRYHKTIGTMVAAERVD